MNAVSEFPGRPGSGITCPCCGGWSLELFEDTMDVAGNIVSMEICLVCSALVNRSSLELLMAAPEQLRDAQTAHLADAYPVGHDLSAVLEHEIEMHRETLHFFASQALAQSDAAELVYAEIGIGRGTLLHPAAALFRRCYAIDITYELFETTSKNLPVPDNVVLLNSITHVPEPIDVVFAWHSFEHVPRLHDLVSAVRTALKPGGYLFFQVPLYRPSHFFASHYTFLNRRAIAVLAEIERFRVVNMWTDHPRAYLTGLLQKPAD